MAIQIIPFVASDELGEVPKRKWQAAGETDQFSSPIMREINVINERY